MNEQTNRADINRIFAARIRALREQAGLSQQQLADDLGITRASLSFYENATRTPNIEVLRNLCIRFDVSADWLIGLSNDRNKEVSAVDELNLTPQAVEKLKNQDGTSGLVNFLLENSLFWLAMTYARGAVACRDLIVERVPEKPRETDSNFFKACTVALQYGTFPVPADDISSFYLAMAGNCLNTAISEIEGVNARVAMCLIDDNAKDYGEYDSVHDLIVRLSATHAAETDETDGDAQDGQKEGS